MEKFGTVLAVVGTIIFIVSIWMVFGYLYFKKGSIKKGLLLLLAVLLLVCKVHGIMQKKEFHYHKK